MVRHECAKDLKIPLVLLFTYTSQKIETPNEILERDRHKHTYTHTDKEDSSISLGVFVNCKTLPYRIFPSFYYGPFFFYFRW